VRRGVLRFGTGELTGSRAGYEKHMPTKKKKRNGRKNEKKTCNGRRPKKFRKLGWQNSSSKPHVPRKESGRRDDYLDPNRQAVAGKASQRGGKDSTGKKDTLEIVKKGLRLLEKKRTTG